MKQGVVGWLWERRNSARTAFIFRMLTMALGMVLSLYWIKVLAGVLGAELYGVFMSFMAVTRLWTLGEAGLGSAVALHAIPLLAQNRQQEVIRFASAARTLFFLLSAFFGGLLLVLIPWLPGWLGFTELPAAGSLSLLFLFGALGIAAGIIGSYVTNLNYAIGNVAWAVLPSFVALQLAFAAQVLLAKVGAALWIQYLPHLLSAAVALWSTWIGVRWSSPQLSTITPLPIDKPIFKTLLASGFWIYLSSLGNLLFTTTGQLIINKGFGPKVVPAYVFNYKIPELTYAVVSAAGLVAFSKIARLINSSAGDQRATGRELFTYLHRLQIWAGMCVAAVYIFLNDAFIQLWLGNDYRVSIYLQLAFAANLVFAAAGDAPIRGVSMFSSANLPYFGRVIFGTGALNLGLSLVFMKLGSLLGIAVATVVAQVALNCLLVARLARHEGLHSSELFVRALVQPLLFVLLLVAVKLWWPMKNLLGQVTAVAAVSLLVVIEFWLLGLRPAQVRAEYKILRGMLKSSPEEATAPAAQASV